METRGGKVKREGALGAFTLLCALLFAASAPAAPLHLPLPPPFPGVPLDHACGTAVDSEGDVYVSSAGESPPKIKIFDPEHNPLGLITESEEEPCGLAVDSKGNLYVSEKASGEVVKYHPNSYPFSGAPIYEPPVTIDASGNAKGISVDRFDDRLYVAEGNRISTYDSEGKLGIDEVQRVLCFECTGGEYKLSFGGEKTVPINYKGPATEVQTALEALSTIGAGNVSVSKDGVEHFVTFIGKFAHTDVEPLVGDPVELVGGAGKKVIIEEEGGFGGARKGFSGHIGEGSLTNATGVAAYTYKVNSETADRYLFAADAGANQVKAFSAANIRSLKLRKTIKGPKAGEDLGFGAAGAYLGVDPGNRSATEKCTEEKAEAEQACTAGHLLVYDEAHKAVDEFEATGEFLDQFTNAAFADAQPTALAVDRSGGADDGTIYVTAGAGPGAEVLAFAPLTAPSRPPRAEDSLEQKGIREVAVDRYGTRYVAVNSTIYAYGPTGKAKIAIEGPKGEEGLVTEGNVESLAVDSACNVYALDKAHGFETEKFVYFVPDACPPKAGTKYKAPVTVATPKSFPHEFALKALAVDPANDHVFVADPAEIMELASAEEGSAVLNHGFAVGLGLTNIESIAVRGATGNVYVSASAIVWVIDPTGTEALARITGAGSPGGPFGEPAGEIAVDQSNGHVLIFHTSRGAAQEFEPSGAFVAQFGSFTKEGNAAHGIAIDNACALHEPPLTEATTPTCKAFDPANGNAYVAYRADAANPFDLTAFGPLTYGGPPIAVTGAATEVGGGEATLNGSVDPRGVALEECYFDYTTEADFQANGFAGPEDKEAECVPGVAEIGTFTGQVVVHARIGGLDPEGRYRFRLFAKNHFGSSEEPKEPGLFGPPVIIAKSAQPILYDEATLRAEIDPSGLATKYHFDYVTQGHFEAEGFEHPESTAEVEFAPGDGAVAVQAALTGLAEGTEYHFRIVAENEAKTVVVEGLEKEIFTTLERAESPTCSNAEYRTRRSAALPDCRAYELVTPPDTRGNLPFAAGPGDAAVGFDNWLITPRGQGAGESLAYFIEGTLPGFEGSGLRDGYRALRTLGEGPHPKTGWRSELFSPTYRENGGGEPDQQGVASDQEYSLWHAPALETFEGTLAAGNYLRMPDGTANPQCMLEPHTQLDFELVGCGSRGTDLGANGRFVPAGGAHVIFTSKEHLEAEAAPQGTEAIYDRAAGASSASVVSVELDGSPFGAAENAIYIAATEDGSAVVFKVGTKLYLHSEGQTTEVATAPNTFAGVSEEGKRVFYAAKASGQEAAGLFACDVEAGPCIGAEPTGLTEIASKSIFVNVSADGSRVFFTSEEAIPGVEPNENGEAAEAGKHNLYVWDGAGTRFLAILDPQDFVGFDKDPSTRLDRWTKAITAGVDHGRAYSPTRSTPGGAVLVFQSHAQLTAYDNTGPCGAKGAAAPCGEIYRYDPAAAEGQRLLCVSCDPTGAPPSADPVLQSFQVTHKTTLIPNVTDDGRAVFFQSADRLLPEDANSVTDVYEWKAPGEGCKRAGGCLALISSGQGEEPSYLYGMSADGRDLFFETQEKLVGADLPGSPSIYDARVEGGIPDPPAPAPCQGDACQGQGSIPPALPSPASTGSVDGNFEEASAPCAKGRHRVKGRCVKKHHKRKRHHRRANHNRGARR